MTIVGRAKLDHPASNTAAGGGTLHTSVESLWTQVSDHLPGRAKQYSALANSTLSTYEHGFGVPFEDLRVNIYTGTLGNLTAVPDPVTSGWTIAATAGFLKTKIDVTTPSSGGPHTFVVQVIEAKRDRFLDLHEVAAPATPPANTVRLYTKADGKVYKKDDTGLEQAVGSGSGAGGINYLVSSNKAWDFEDGVVTGWSAYADAAATSPVDGTGGSPNVTFAASSSSPLRGVYSGLFTKDAANRQGQGTSVDFTLDNAEKGELFSFRFDAEASSAFANGDVRVYVYDVTNAALLPGYFPVSPGSSEVQGYFLATTSTSYRFILHVASTNASAWTLKIDNVKIGPFEYLSGPTISDYIAADTSLITTQGFGTPTWNFYHYKIVGDMIHVNFEFTSGTATAVEARVGLPSGLTAKINTSVWPSGYLYNNNGGSPVLVGAESNNAYVTFNDPANFATKFNGTSVATSGWVLSAKFCVPVNQYSANTQLAKRELDEFVFNTSTNASSSDTTSFGYGASGNLIGSITANINRRVRFQKPVLPTDRITIELDVSGTGQWVELGNTPADLTNGRYIRTYHNENTTTYGISIREISTTDYDVVFGEYRATSGATFGSAGDAWSQVPDARWRVRKVSSGASVGFPVLDKNVIRYRLNNTSTGNIDNLEFDSQYSVIKFTGSAPVLRGVSSNRIDGFVLTLISATGTSLTINDQDSNSSAESRIITGSGAAVTITADGSASIMYDSESQRWRLISSVS